jgi:hypothetical protein
MRDPSESRVSKNYNASTEALFTYFVPVSVNLIKITNLGTRHFFFRLVRRMEHLKQMREEMHGKYTELTDEKEIIRTCA